MLVVLDSLEEAVERRGSPSWNFAGHLYVLVAGVVFESNEIMGKLLEKIPNELYKSERCNSLSAPHPHRTDQ